MPNYDIRGMAIVWGTDSIVGKNSAGTSVLFGKDASGVHVALITNCTYNLEADQQENHDNNGNVISVAVYNQRIVYDVTVIPVGADNVTNAKTNLRNLVIPVGTVVQVVDPENPKLDSGGQKMLVRSCKVGRTNKGQATVDLSLVWYIPNDVTKEVTI